jgi:hypothetical protein
VTVAILAAGWIVLAGIVSPPGSRLLWRLAPRLQAAVLVTTIGALALPDPCSGPAHKSFYRADQPRRGGNATRSLRQAHRRVV